MIDIMPQLPLEDQRYITVGGLNLPEFPRNEELQDPHFPAVFGAMANWVDMTLAFNQTVVDDSAQIPEELWVPTKRNGLIQLASRLMIVHGEEDEYLSYSTDEKQTVKTVTTTSRRTISKAPAKVSPSLDQIFLYEEVAVTGDFMYKHDGGNVTRKLGDISVDSGWHSTPAFYNTKTGRSPARATAEKMALRSAKNILAMLGYDQPTFYKHSSTYSDYVANLSE